MPKAVRFKSNGKYLRNTIFSCPSLDYVGSGTAMRDDFDPTNEQMMALVAEEEALSTASWTKDLAAGFGLPVDSLVCEVIAGWDGDPATLPKEDEPDALVMLPVAPEPPPPPTFEELVAQASTFDELKALVLAQGSGA